MKGTGNNMSDALTDLARDGRRAELYKEFIGKLTEYLKNNNEETFEELETLAARLDSVPRGYWNGQTTILEGLPKFVASLKDNDEKVWGSLLISLSNDWEYSRLYKELKELSPFKDKILISVNYGCGFVNFRGDLESVCNRIISKENNMRTYDADHYLLVLPEESFKNVKVLWQGCGIMSPDVPKDKPRTAR